VIETLKRRPEQKRDTFSFLKLFLKKEDAARERTNFLNATRRVFVFKRGAADVVMTLLPSRDQQRCKCVIVVGFWNMK
jgi:hypothetical protein